MSQDLNILDRISDIRCITEQDPNIRNDLKIISESMQFAFEQIEYNFSQFVYPYDEYYEESMLNLLYSSNSIEDILSGFILKIEDDQIEATKLIKEKCFTVFQMLSAHKGRCMQASHYSAYYVRDKYDSNFTTYLMSSLDDPKLKYCNSHMLAVFNSNTTGRWYANSCSNFVDTDLSLTFCKIPGFQTNTKVIKNFQRGTSIISGTDLEMIKSIVVEIEGGSKWKVCLAPDLQEMCKLHPIRIIPENWYEM